MGAVAYGTVGEGGGGWLVPTGWCARDRSCFSNKGGDILDNGARRQGEKDVN